MSKKKEYGTIALLVMICAVLLPQTAGAIIPTEEWNKTYGGVDLENVFSVQQTPDGGYIFAGFKMSNNNTDSAAWLVKTDINGDEEWNKTFRGKYSSVAESVRQTSDGGYILVGSTSSDIGFRIDRGPWLIKVYANGTEQWNKTYGGFNDESGVFAQQASDGGYIMAAVSYTYDANGWLVKTDVNGNEEWNRTFESKTYGAINSIQQTSDDGYILIGSSRRGVWLVKTDVNGNEEWNKTFEEAGYVDVAESVQQTTDGGYIFAGYTGLYGAGNYDVWLVKTDSNGNQLWSKTFGEAGYDDAARSVQQTSDGGYILAGYANLYAGNYHAWIIKTDLNGNQLWNKKIGESNNDAANSVQQTSDGGYILAGYTTPYGTECCDAWLVKLSSDADSTPTPTTAPTPSSTPTVTPTPNQPPTASFTYSPTNPKAGEQITFNASGSSDPDGKVVLAEWDWDNDRIYDERTDLATAIFWFPNADTYTLNLRVTDDKGSTNVQSKQITVSPSDTGRKTIVVASLWYSSWNPILWFNQDYKDFVKIDEWIREKPTTCHLMWGVTFKCWKTPSGSEPLDWLKSDPRFSHLEEPDVINLLKKEADQDNLPGLTYKQQVLSSMREENIVHNAFQYGMSSYLSEVKVLVKYLTPSLPAVMLDAAINFVPILYPSPASAAIGLSTLLNGIEVAKTVNEYQDLSDQLDQEAYVEALGIYFGNIQDCGYPGTDECLNAQFNDALMAHLNLPPLSAEDKDTTEAETKAYWKDLWRKYGNKADINGDKGTEFSAGLKPETRQDARDQVKQVLISAFEKRETILTLNREYIHLASPGELRVYDVNGNVTGLVNGEIKEEIPYSLYDPETKTVDIYGVSDSYRYEIKGTGTGVYGLHIDSLRNGTAVTFNATAIPMLPEQNHLYAIDWDALSRNEQGITLQIDYTSDGTFDRTIKAGLNLTDITPPEISITAPINGTSYILNQSVISSWIATDSQSGINTTEATTPNESFIDTSTVGLRSFTVNVTDNAGNEATKTVVYNVIYNYSSILQPINSNNSSIFKFGSIVPVKFQLTDSDGNYVSSAIAKIYVAKIDNGIVGSDMEANSTSAATTGNQFRYDAISNQYIFNWGTRPLTTGTGTYQIKIELNDRTSKYVNIGLK